MSHKHSPLPWRATNDGCSIVKDWADTAVEIATVSFRLSWHENEDCEEDEAIANAAFIAHACNSHDDLFRQATKSAKEAEKLRAENKRLLDSAKRREEGPLDCNVPAWNEIDRLRAENAELWRMRAAPDLLAALENIADRAENFIAAGTLPLPLHIHATGLLGGMRDLCDDARAAIAKATGKTP